MRTPASLGHFDKLAHFLRVDHVNESYPYQQIKERKKTRDKQHKSNIFSSIQAKVSLTNSIKSILKS